MGQLTASAEAEVSTLNKKLNREIKVKTNVSVPASIAEAQEFYGGEEKLVEVLQAETVRRKINAARAVIRDIDNPDTDWDKTVREIAEDYTPGRRGGFGRVEISEDELANVATSGSLEELMAFLREKGARIGAGADGEE